MACSSPRTARDILISIQSEREWKKLCAEVLDQPDLPNDPRFASMVERVRNRALTDKTVADSFATMTRVDLLKRLDDADIAFAEVNTMADLAVHPHLRRIEVDTPNGKVSYAAPAAIFVGEPRHYGAVPGIGEHTSSCPKLLATGPNHHDGKTRSRASAWLDRKNAPRLPTSSPRNWSRACAPPCSRTSASRRPAMPRRGPCIGAWRSRCFRCRKLGPDGHPTRGGFLPPVPLPRRMWAGGELEFFEPLRVGDEATRTSRISDVTMKTGSTGVLCFVSVEHLITHAARHRDPRAAGHRLSGHVERRSRLHPPRRRRRRPSQNTAKATWPIRCCCFAIRR